MRHMLLRRIRALLVLVIFIAAAAGAWLSAEKSTRRTGHDDTEFSSQAKRPQRLFSPTAAQWKTLTVEPVTKQVFRAEHVTEGKIAVNEDRSTAIFSPYSGRVTKLAAQPGDTVTPGQLLFVIEAADMVQAQNDFVAAVTAKNKARSQLTLAEIVEKRHRELYKDKAVALKELEQAQAASVAAQNDMRAAETALEAVRNRLRILGKTDDEITAFEQTGKISAETPIYAPIAGTIVQRKIGPGQYVGSGTSEPIFVIGDLSSVWLIAYVRETEASKIRIGQPINFSLLAYPGEVHRGNIGYVATTLDPSTRRLLVRATIPNQDGALKPEMYSSVSIFTDEGGAGPAAPLEAVIYEGSTAHVWVAHEDKTIELRQITPGASDGRMIEVLDGLRPGEMVITKGSLFIDRAALGS